ncbi:MAG: type II and III secretion system protein family protein [Desulfobulbaceae bacterium]|nr:type II and III secretion system protein family protein [Desulfobulbaceae bacterium]
MNRRHAKITTSALILALIALFCSQAWGQAPERKTLELKKGGSDIITTEFPVQRISIADPSVADVVVLSPKQIYVFGKQVGYSSVMLWEKSKTRALLDVTVTLDLTGLKEKIYQLFPDQQIEVYGSETGIVLNGTVSGPEVVEEVLRLAQSFLPKEGSGGGAKQGTGKSGSGITNLLKVGGIQQVMLEVKFAEVNRDSGKGLQAGVGYSSPDSGSDVKGAFGIGTLGVSKLGEFSLDTGSILVNFTDNLANVFVNIKNINAALQFLETEGMARTLAEPRLVTLSGQEASFLAGGEFPVPVPNETGTVSIDFKSYGVALTFTPIVLSGGKISLRVAPQVSDVIYTSAVPVGASTATFQIPSLTTRKLDTTVELHDGQSLALAGLLQDNITETVKKIPGLGDIPVLGALFRSTSFTQKKTDLLIAVTPHIVKPVKEGELSFPGDNFQLPDRYEFYLEGKLEGSHSPEKTPGLSRHDFSPAQTPLKKTGGLEGAFGHQPVSAE